MEPEKDLEAHAAKRALPRSQRGGGNGANLATAVKQGLWQTPVADDAVERVRGKINSRGEPKLSAQVLMWPTPTVDGNYNRKGLSPASGDGLATAVAMWPTPTASLGGPEPEGKTGRKLATMVAKFPTPCATDHKTGYPQDSAAGVAQRAKRAKPLRDTAAPGGQLNPTWVEWLMGWPIGWTDCAASATARYRPWCASHGKF
jgi:hypothetical protein